MQPHDRPSVIPFSTEVLPKLEQVGQKAYRLIELTKAGLPVPEGFAIPVKAYHSFLDTLPLAPLDPQDPGVETQLEKIRTAMLEAPLPDELGRAIGDATQRIGGRVVVRFSGTSRLLISAPGSGLDGVEKVIGAIKECWASLWCPQVYAHCQQRRIPFREFALGVVIQSFIPAEVSGILTTTNPASGQEEEMMIAACWGLGEALGTGKVTPDRYMVSPENIEGIIAEKTTAIFSSEEGPYEAKVDPREVNKRTLDDRKARELYELGRKVKKMYDSPQIIDFAYATGRFYLLRARPFLKCCRTEY